MIRFSQSLCEIVLVELQDMKNISEGDQIPPISKNPNDDQGLHLV